MSTTKYTLKNFTLKIMIDSQKLIQKYHKTFPCKHSQIKAPGLSLSLSLYKAKAVARGVRGGPCRTHGENSSPLQLPPAQQKQFEISVQLEAHLHSSVAFTGPSILLSVLILQIAKIPVFLNKKPIIATYFLPNVFPGSF